MDGERTPNAVTSIHDDIDPELAKLYGPEAEFVLTADALNEYRDQELDSNQQWRIDSAIERDYYHGNQLDSEVIAKWRKRGIPIMVVNRMRKSINGIVGLQERNLTDFKVRAEGLDTDLAEALSSEMKIAERETKTDYACLDAFSGMVQGGIDWVEVAPETDPFKFHTRVKQVPWREMRWDRNAPDLSDATWIRRLRFLPRKQLMKRFKRHAEQIRTAGTGALDWYEPWQKQRGDEVMRSQPRWSDHWIRGDNLLLEEVWYKVEVQGYVVTLKSGITAEWSPKNPSHMAAYQQGLVEPRVATFTKVRQAYWIGPIRLVDRWSPLPHNEYPYVPFICYSEDSTGDPYGVGRDLRYLQDEINVRRAKMAYALDATRAYVEDSAVEDHATTMDELGRKDAYIKTKDGAVSGGKIKVDEHQGIASQQYEIYKDAEATIQDVGGTPDPFLGETDTPGQSGVAMNVRIDQTMTTLGKVNRNFRQARNKVGELLFAHVVAKMGQNQSINFEDPVDGTQKQVVVNQSMQDEETGLPYINNNLQQMRLKVVLDEVPSTATYRMQQFTEIMRALTGAPDVVQQVLWPTALELSEIPNRKQSVKLLKKKLGMSEPETPEEEAQLQRDSQNQQRVQDAEIRTVEAKAAKEEAQTQAITAKLQPETELIIAKVEELFVRIAQMQQDMKDQAALMAAGGPEKSEALLKW